MRTDHPSFNLTHDISFTFPHSNDEVHVTQPIDIQANMSRGYAALGVLLAGAFGVASSKSQPLQPVQPDRPHCLSANLP